MKNLIFVAILWLASLTFAHAFDTQNIIMAVSEFTVATPKVTKADAATMATLLETPFVQSGIVDVVEREKIGLVYRNLNLVPAS
ncbi:MAG: hypothetical protein IPK21_15480 [Haliscomenobacter sp.]|nr:hypothetical protein [Haliscomenobacter sp.]